MATIKGKWLFNEAIKRPSTSITQSINFISNDTAYTQIRMWADDGELDYYASGWYTFYVDYEGWDADVYRTVDFGTTEQTVSDEFYTWFTSNAKPAVTDLTGTTWYVPSGWSATAGYGIFNLHYVVNYLNGEFPEGIYPEYDEFDELDIGSDGFVNSINTICFDYDDAWLFDYDNSNSFTITFAYGTDATNPDLIAWLYANGELQEDRITDLTGYTVTVPAGWSATVGYGIFSVNGTYDSYPLGELGIGYEERGISSSDYLFTAQSSTTPIAIYDSTQNIEFYFESGADVTNTSLIQWLYDNNATFEKTGGEEETPEEDTTSTATITYDGATVTLKEGQSVTFRFAEKVCKSDIVIRNIGGVKQIDTFEYAQTNAWGSTPIYRDFEVGMTWAEFIDSDYNAEQQTIYDVTNGIYILGKFILNADDTVSFKGHESDDDYYHTLSVYTYVESDREGRDGTLTKSTELISSVHPYWSSLGSGSN